jgi:hypothetical protein
MNGKHFVEPIEDDLAEEVEAVAELGGDSVDSVVQQKRLRFLEREKRGFFSYKDSLGFVVVGSLLFQLLNLTGLFLLYGAHSRLANKPPAALVQTESGEAFPVAAVGSLERTPSVIKAFVLDSLTMLFTWSGTLPESVDSMGMSEGEPAPDEGVETEGGKRVATTAAVGAYALSPDFRKEMLSQLAEMTPPGVFSGETQVFFEPLSITEPVSIASGEWKIVLVGNLIVVSQTRNLEDQIPFNKEIFIRAVVPPRTWKGTSPLARSVASVRAAGLEIFEMRDFQE